MRAMAFGSELTNFSPIPNYSAFRATASYIYKDDGVEEEDDNSFRGILCKINHTSKSLTHYCAHNKQ